MGSTRKESDPVKIRQFCGALLAMLSLFLLLFLLSEATPDTNVISITFDEETHLTTFTRAQETFHREQQRNRIILIVMLGVSVGGAVGLFFSAEKIKNRQCASSETSGEQTVGRSEEARRQQEKKEAGLRRLHAAGLLDREELHARLDALREEEKP